MQNVTIVRNYLLLIEEREDTYFEIGFLQRNRENLQFRIFKPETGGLQNPQKKILRLSKSLHNFILENL